MYCPFLRVSFIGGFTVYCIKYFVVGVPPHVPVTAMDHCYCKPSVGVAAMELKTRSIEHTCLAVEPDEVVQLGGPKAIEAMGPGCRVNLLSSLYEVVGTATIMSGTLVHGHDIPEDFNKVAINQRFIHGQIYTQMTPH